MGGGVSLQLNPTMVKNTHAKAIIPIRKCVNVLVQLQTIPQFIILIVSNVIRFT